MSEETNTSGGKRSAPKTRQGIVLKNQMDKTVVVEVIRRVRHPTYPKFIRRRRRYKAHDAQNRCDVGDKVLIEETRPVSKTKRWRVKAILKRAASV